MPDRIVQISQTLQSAYNEQYSDAMTQWRELGGKYKAANILTVCRRHNFSKVLECGAGDGSILKFLDASDKFSELYAIEISDSGIKQINKRNLPKLREVKKFNGYEIPYPDNHFDMAYCSHVIEHVEHPRLLLRELKRVSNYQVFEVPLDYSVGVDRRVEYFLSYGHINIYTPSLFRFLLKSEGYKIVEDLLTHSANEIVRYGWYQNMKLKKTLHRELLLALRPVVNFLKHRSKEYGFSAYTCLAKGSGELKILGTA